MHPTRPSAGTNGFLLFHKLFYAHCTWCKAWPPSLHVCRSKGDISLSQAITWPDNPQYTFAKAYSTKILQKLSQEKEIILLYLIASKTSFCRVAARIAVWKDDLFWFQSVKHVDFTAPVLMVLFAAVLICVKQTAWTGSCNHRQTASSAMGRHDDFGWIWIDRIGSNSRGRQANGGGPREMHLWWVRSVCSSILYVAHCCTSG